MLDFCHQFVIRRRYAKLAWFLTINLSSNNAALILFGFCCQFAILLHAYICRILPLITNDVKLCC